MRALLAGALFLALSALPAQATAGLSCSFGEDGYADLAIGNVPGFALVGARFGYADKAWSIHGADTAIVVTQAFSTGDLLLADFADENLQEVLVRLRLFVGADVDANVTAGIIQFPERTFPITCEGP